LTLAVALGAAQAGALIAPRCRALAVSSGQATIEDRIGSAPIEVRARAILLATGPWKDLLPPGVAIRTARGAHLAVRSTRLPVPAHLALRSPDDGRLIFAMPVGAYTVLGTTDVDDTAAPQTVHATRQDVDYLLPPPSFFTTPPSTARRHRRLGGPTPAPRRPGTERDPDRLSRRHVVVRTPGHLRPDRRQAHHASEMADDALASIESAPRFAARARR
jgi:glycerol-3-phosphate dehydrogenase